MRNLPSKWFRPSRRFLGIIIGGSVIAYVGFLLVSNYFAQLDLQNNLLRQLSLENESRALSLSYFFSDRKDDLSNIALSREISVYFENKALGMSMEYGLNLSLIPIRERFSNLIDRKKIGEDLVYSKIVFIDRDGRKLVDASPSDTISFFHKEWKRYLSPAYRNGAIITSDDGKEIVVSIAYEFKGHYSGQIVAWLKPDTIYKNFLKDISSSSRQSYIVMIKDKTCVAIHAELPSFLASLPEAPSFRISGLPFEFEIQDGNGKLKKTAVLSPIRDTILFHASIKNTGEIIGELSPDYLLIRMGILAIVILGGAVFILVLSIKSLLLQTSLDESIIREREIEEKNIQLETEVLERRRIENALRESEQRSRSILDAIHAGIVIIDPETHRIVDVNHVAANMIGASREAIIGSLCHSFICPAEQGYCPITDIGQSVDQSEKILLKADHTRIPIIKNVVPITLNGRKHLLESFIDITQRKKAENALRESEELFRSLMDNMLDSVVIAGFDSTILFANHASGKMAEVENSEALIGKNIADFLHPVHVDMAISDLSSLTKGKRVSPGEYKIITKKGNEKWMSSLAAEIIFKDSPAYLITLRNITERKEMEENIKRAREMAEEANRAKSEFLANMSHELRTPLNAIIGFTEVVLGKNFGELNANQEEYLGDVLQSSRHLLSLINDILDLSKIESGKLELILSECNLHNFLNASLVMVREKAMKHRLKLNTDFKDIPEIFKTDERKLKQILYNLLSNAVKFTPDGGSITLSAKLYNKASLKPEERAGNIDQNVSDNTVHFIKFSVSDTGIGIKSADLERIFKPFEQADASISRKYQGTGLGLSLSKKLTDFLGGDIWAESKGTGGGSTFSFIIPMCGPPGEQS